MIILLKTTANYIMIEAQKGISEFLQRVEELNSVIIEERENYFVLKETIDE